MRYAETAKANTEFKLGWRIVLAVSLCNAMLVGAGLSGFIMISGPMAAELGWTQAESGNLVSAMWLAGPLVLVAAPLIKRWGPWRLLASGMVLTNLTIALVAITRDYTAMFLLRLIAGAGLMLFIASSPVIIAQWFKTGFATAMAIVWSSTSAGQMLMVPITVEIIEAFGWRMASLLLAGGVGVGALVAILLTRRAAALREMVAPQSLDPSDPRAAETVDGRPHEADLPWGQALRSMSWITAPFMCVAALGAGATSLAFQAHAPSLLRELGFSDARGALLISIYYATTIVGATVAGWLLDRVAAAAISLSVSAVVFGPVAVLLLGGQNVSYLVVGLMFAVFGVGLGAGEVLWITLFKRQFGRAAFATTYGIFFFSYLLGMSAGGYVGGLGFETGGGHALLLTLVALYVAPALFSIWRPGGRNTEQP